MVSPTPAYTPPPEADVYTLCDEIPRMRVNISTTHTPYTRWSVTPPATISGAPPEPNCTVVPSDCSQLLSSYSIQHGVPPAVTLGRIHPYMSYLYDDWPRCTTNTIPSAQPGADCGIYGQHVQLMYWPQVWAEGEGKDKYCNALVGHSESITLGPTIAGQPNTVVSGTHTFTSPTVYIKYQALSASDWGGHIVGPTLYDSYMAIDSTSVSTKLPYFWTSIPWEGPGGLLEIARSTGIINAKMEHGYTGINLNYADEHAPLTYPDLANPVPALPYYQWRVKLAYYDDTCWMGGCPTMMPWDYGPVLAIPDAMRDLAPEWKSCTLPWGAMDDPPMALVTQISIVMPTAPVAISLTTPASPSPATALLAQQTDTGNGGGDVARTTANALQPIIDDDTQPTKQKPTNVAQPAGSNGPSPATPVDNQPSRTSSTQNVAGVIASLLGNAGALAPTSQPGATAGAEAHDSGASASIGSSDEPPSGQNGDASPGQDSDSGALSEDQSNSSSGFGGSASRANVAQPGQEINNEVPSTDVSRDKDAIGQSGVPANENDGDEGHESTNTHASGGAGDVVAPADAPDGASFGGSSHTSPHGHPVNIAVGSETIVAQPAEGSSTVIVVGSQTLAAGGPGATVDGHSISVESDGKILVDGTAAGQVGTDINANPTANAGSNGGFAVAVTFAPGEAVTAQRGSGSANKFVVGTQTLSAGGSGAVVDGHWISVAGDGQLVIDGSAAGSIIVQSGSTAQLNAPFTIGTQVFTIRTARDSSGIIVLGGEIPVESGAVATLDGHTVPLNVHGKVHVDGSALSGLEDQSATSTFAFTGLTESIAALTLRSEKIFAEATTLSDGRAAAVIAGTTVTSGSAALTMNGNFVSYGSEGLVVQTPEVTASFTASKALITAGPHIYTVSKPVFADGQTAVIIGTHTLRLGDDAQTINGDVFSLASNGVLELDDASTAAFLTSAKLVTVNGRTLLVGYTVAADGMTQAIVGTETLTLGGPAESVNGVSVSLGLNGLIIGADEGGESAALKASAQTSLVSAGKAQASATETGTPNTAWKRRPWTAMLWTLVVAGVSLRYAGR